MIVKIKMAYHAFMKSWFWNTWIDELKKFPVEKKAKEKNKRKAAKAKARYEYHSKLC